jgi:hypothetical protein
MRRIIPAADAGKQGARAHRGLTVIDLTILIAVMACVAALGLRQVALARRHVREELALQNLRALGKGCRWHVRASGAVPVTLAQLADVDPPYVPPALAGPEPVKQGYTFRYQPDPKDRFVIWADPTSHGVTGARHYLIDHTLTVYATDENRPATADDDILE